MKPSARLIALGATAMGLWLARGQLVSTDDVLAVAPARRTAAAPRTDVGTNGESSSRTGPALPARAALERESADPFALPRVAVKPLPPAPPPPPPAPPPRPPAPAPAAAPRVPYRFVGMLTENGKPSSVYLSLGATLIDARPGDVLEGGYQLQSITARQLNFLHQQSNLTVPLTVDGEPL
jgi:hypothetical protein